MPLILAIEPDRRQAAKLADLIRGRLRAELVHAETTERALVALAQIGDRVPDLILVPSLLSPQEDAALAGALRVIATAANVQMLTIPMLADREQPQAQRGMFARFRPRKAKHSPGACDPAVFADQIAAYLAEAASRAEAERDAASTHAEEVLTWADSPAQAASAPAAESDETPPFVMPPIAAEPPPRVSIILEAPVDFELPASSDLYAHDTSEPEPPAPTALDALVAEFEPHTESVVRPLEIEEIVVTEPPVPSADLPVFAAAEAVEDLDWLEVLAALPEQYSSAATPREAAAPLVADLRALEPDTIARAIEEAAERIAVPQVFDLAAFEPEPTSVVEEDVPPTPVVDTTLSAIEPDVIPEESRTVEALIAPLLREIEASTARAAAVPLGETEDVPTTKFEAALPVETTDVPTVKAEALLTVETTDMPTVTAEAVPIVETGSVPIVQADDVPVAAAGTEPDPMFFAGEDSHAPFVPAGQQPQVAPRQPERPAWVELIESLRQDVERLKAERPHQGMGDSPTRSARPAVLRPRRRGARPVQDQWGLFDPDQCGFGALLNKLDELSAREEVSA